MNNLLLFFAIPVATIILSIVLQKIIRSPLLVAATFFAIFLVVAFAFFDESFLIFVIAYTIISYISALITRFICCLIRNSCNPCINRSLLDDNDNNDCNEDDNNDNMNNNMGCCCNRSIGNNFFPRRYMIGRR